ncbi:MAG: hypothetical protein VYD54_08180 [Bdellovibrionota bacterium]|nr:hypothetical protein [Bdellovibrionota bacterium]
MKNIFLITLIFSVSWVIHGKEKGEDLFREMERDYREMKVRSWLPTSMAGRGSKGSEFFQWVKEKVGPNELEGHLKKLKNGNLSASCFEIVILFSLKAGIVEYDEVKRIFLEKDRHRFPPRWIRAWLYSLSGGKSKRLRTSYVRAKRPSYTTLEKTSKYFESDWGVPHKSYDKGKRVFPKAGDIIFFNPMTKKGNTYFDHVALATGRKVTRGQACDEFIKMEKRCRSKNIVCEELKKSVDFCEEYKKIRPKNEPLEAEILSFYGRGSRKDAPIERTTVEHMLDGHSLIKRNAPEGGDRQVFFSTAPWAK